MDYAQYLESLVRGIVEYEDDVRVESSKDDMGILITLHVRSEDMGRIVGRMGHTAQAIRTILRVVGMKHQARVSVRIAEPVVE